MKSLTYIGGLAVLFLASGASAKTHAQVSPSSKFVPPQRLMHCRFATHLPPLACKTLHMQTTRIKQHITYPVDFCKYYLSAPRENSPVPGFTGQNLMDGCNCFDTKPHRPAHSTTQAPFAQYTDAPSTDVSATDSDTATDGTALTEPSTVISTSIPVSITFMASTTSATPYIPNVNCSAVPTTIVENAVGNIAAQDVVDASFKLVYNSAGTTQTAAAVISSTEYPYNDTVPLSDVVTSCALWVIDNQSNGPGAAFNLFIDDATLNWTCNYFQDGGNGSLSYGAKDASVGCSFGFEENRFVDL
ncbi:hypothetical protein ANO11243_007660 [Dothideomycetidae sp. 11243]|nr:hypothetical protein ANO11243_007660 [fungal sp. No.11243]